jgi:membrane-bound lytic murein transglycosylase D
MMLVSVAAIESSFNPAALSPKGARGLWQLMPETARRFGLLVETQGDERLDPVKSTFAAARYLKELHAQFGDWPLALAAYNAGAERVQRSLERLGARDFWTLRRRLALPEETRRYVPTVLARAEGLLSAGNTEGSAPEWQPDSKPLSSTRIQPKVVYALTSPVP